MKGPGANSWKKLSCKIIKFIRSQKNLTRKINDDPRTKVLHRWNNAVRPAHALLCKIGELDMKLSTIYSILSYLAFTLGIGAFYFRQYNIATYFMAMAAYFKASEIAEKQ